MCLSGCVFRIVVSWEQLGSRIGQNSPKGALLICRKARRAIGLKAPWFTLRSCRSGVRISPGAPDLTVPSLALLTLSSSDTELNFELASAVTIEVTKVALKSTACSSYFPSNCTPPVWFLTSILPTIRPWNQTLQTRAVIKDDGSMLSSCA